MRTSWEIEWAGENSVDQLDTAELRMPSRVLHDWSFSYRWRSGTTIGIDVGNVFDRDTRDLSRYPLPDRVVLLRIGWRSSGGAS